MTKEQLEKEMQTDYPLINMIDITDEARMLAVAWCEGYEPMGSINLESKHKLASDIMNYARRNSIIIDKALEIAAAAWDAGQARLMYESSCEGFEPDRKTYLSNLKKKIEA